MTANEPTDARSHNSGVNRPDVPPQRSESGLFDWLLGTFTPGENQSIALSEDALYECLLTSRRRKLIRLLAGTYDPDGETYLEVQEIADAFAHAHHEEVGWEERKRYYVSLIQTHLPVLDEHGLIEYYERPKKVRPTGAVVPVANVIEDVASRCDPAARERSSTVGGDDE